MRLPWGGKGGEQQQQQSPPQRPPAPGVQQVQQAPPPQAMQPPIQAQQAPPPQNFPPPQNAPPPGAPDPNAVTMEAKVSSRGGTPDVTTGVRRIRGRWTLEQLRQTDGIIPLQYGTNKFDSQKDMTVRPNSVIQRRNACLFNPLGLLRASVPRGTQRQE